MKRIVAVAVLLAALQGPLVGCAGTVSLKRAEPFTPARVKAIQFDDTCRLQRYFDARPMPPEELQSAMLSVGAEKGAYGQATLRLAPGVQRQTFLRLLRTYYRIDSAALAEKENRLTVPFYEPPEGSERRQLPIGGVVLMQGREGQVALEYHPCLGEFFFGQRTYTVRRQILDAESRRPTAQRGALDARGGTIPSPPPKAVR